MIRARLILDAMKRTITPTTFFLISLGVLLWGWRALPWTGPVDDAFITMTYARHLAEGDGLVFNPGERVEGATAFGHVLLLAPFAAAGIDRLDLVSVVLGILAWAAALAIGYALFLSDRRETGAAVAVGPFEFLFLAFLVIGPMGLVWSTAAMETPLVALAWMAALFAHAREHERGAPPFLSALCVVAAGLLRPDGILVAIPLGLSWLLPIARARWRQAIVYSAIVIALFGGYWLWRWSYFGYFTPNTFAAKVGTFSGPLALKGIGYLIGAGMALVFPPIFLMLLFTRRREIWPRLPRWFFVAIGQVFVTSAFAIFVGGDFFPYHRFLVPSLIPGTLAAWKLFRVRLCARRERLSRPPAAPATARTWIGVASLLLFWWAWATGSLLLDFYKARMLVNWTRDWTTVGRALEEITPPDAALATVPIGAIGYHSRRRVLDMVGLTDLHIGRREQRTGARIVGHEKHDTAYVLDRAPELILTWPVLFDGFPKEDSDWVYAHTIATAQRDIYLSPRTFKLYAPIFTNIGDGILLGLLRRDLVNDARWRAFKPLPAMLERRYFDPERFRFIRRPSWNEAFSKMKNKTHGGEDLWK
ncbi:hypothetical protein K8I61_10050 [bacterium]|nr:hypothetical protein [bacterium]